MLKKMLLVAALRSLVSLTATAQGNGPHDVTGERPPKKWQPADG
jgi:hypothetical protein